MIVMQVQARSRAVMSEWRCVVVDQRCRESEGKAKIEGYMSVSDEEAHQWFNLVRVEICELRPEVVTEGDDVLVHYQSRTMCDEGYLLRHLLRKIKGRESTYSGSEDL